MKRFWSCVLLLAIAQPAWARGDDAPYYGPMKRRGIGFEIGYKDRVEKDGSWRIDAAIHARGDAIDMALYRAAERAHDLGYRYLFLLGGSESRSPGLNMATVYARPSHDAGPPIGCRSRKMTSCYTADVLEILRILGGPDGSQPGVPILASRDAFGREVYLSGYGTGGVASLVPGGIARSNMTTIVDGGTYIRGANLRPSGRALDPVAGAARPLPAPTAIVAPPVFKYVPPSSSPPSAEVEADARFDQALKAAQPVRGRDPKLGWTISD